MRLFTRAMDKATKRSAIRANVARDEQIVADRRAGMLWRAIARKHGISRERCGQIWRAAVSEGESQ